MSGFTSHPYRQFMRPFGVSLSFTEMVSDKGLIHRQRKSEEYLEFEEEGPTGLQLFGGDPEELAKGASRAMEINPRLDLVDINMGCPVNKITKNGGGSFLMKDPRKCGEIIRILKKTVDVPVTAKIRLGWDLRSVNYLEVISELEAAGVDCISLHVRTREEGYAGTPDYSIVRNLRDLMTVPLIISGNIYSLGDAVYALDATGAEGVMIARGGVGNPFLVTQIKEYYDSGTVLPNPTVSQQIDWCLQFMNMLCEYKGIEETERRMRSYAPRFIAGCRYGKEYRNMLATETRNLDDLHSALESIREARGDEQMMTSVGIPSSKNSLPTGNQVTYEFHRAHIHRVPSFTERWINNLIDKLFDLAFPSILI